MLYFKHGLQILGDDMHSGQACRPASKDLTESKSIVMCGSYKALPETLVKHFCPLVKKVKNIHLLSAWHNSLHSEKLEALSPTLVVTTLFPS